MTAAPPTVAISHPPPGISPAEWETRVHLAACYRLLAWFGFHDLTYNHLSARSPDAPHLFLIKGERQLFEDVTASSLALYGFDGVQARPGPQTVSPGGLVIHGGVLEARPDLVAVFHTHSPANIAVGAGVDGLLPICQHALLFHDRLAYHAFEGFEFDPAGRGRLVADLGPHRAMLMRNHGALVCGRTVAEAYFLHHYLEMACRAQVAALSAGRDRLILPRAEVCETGARQMESRGVVTAEGRDWPALLALAGRVAPGFDA